MRIRAIAVSLLVSTATLPTLAVDSASSIGARPQGPEATTSCTPAHLLIEAITVLAAGGNNGVLLAYRNTGTRRCWIRGYIRATVYGAAHAEAAIDHPSVYVGGLQSVSGTAVSPRTVPTAWLSHGEAAYEILGGSDTPMGAASTCPTATSARIRLVFEDAFSSATVSLTVALPEWWLCIGPIATPIVPFVSQHYGGITYHQRGSYFVP